MATGFRPLADKAVSRFRTEPALTLGAVMRLNPPTVLIFLVSILLASLAIMTKLQIFPIPRHLPHQEFWLAIVAYFTLMVGNIVRGL